MQLCLRRLKESDLHINSYVSGLDRMVYVSYPKLHLSSRIKVCPERGIERAKEIAISSINSQLDNVRKEIEKLII
jgi:hypothetical protein